jgi:hypothetical protein
MRFGADLKARQSSTLGFTRLGPRIWVRRGYGPLTCGFGGVEVGILRTKLIFAD